MAQSANTQNFLIHDANGKPQMIKVVHTTGPTKAWRTSQNPTVVRTSGFIKTVQSTTPVKQLYTEDDEGQGPPPKGFEEEARTKGQFSTRSYHLMFAPLIENCAGVSIEDSSSGNIVLGRKTVTPGGNQMYKVVRRPEVVQKVIQISPQEMQAIQSQSEASNRLSGSSPSFKRVQVKSGTSNGKQRATEADFFSDFKKRRRSEKGGKGLRHFSMKVCEKVREKGLTTYNEVADELVAEFTGSPFQPNQEQNYDQKNIRRRVYDALNVLMAMNIISKEKKEIRWLGLPTGYPKMSNNSMRSIDKERQTLCERIALKKKTLQSLILQQVAFKNLVERNKAVEAVRGRPLNSSTIQLPMLVVSTNQNTTVNCSVSNDRKEYFFSFDDIFEIKDESHVLDGMGMMMGLHTGLATPEDLIRAKTMIPRSLAPILEEMVQSNVEGESSGSGSYLRKEEFEEGPVYLEESESASESEMDTH